jgi:hypothetical protein
MKHSRSKNNLVLRFYVPRSRDNLPSSYVLLTRSEIAPSVILLLETTPDAQLLNPRCSSSWGAKNPKFEIGRYTPVFDVPRNLNTALYTIMALTDAGKCRTLWIDQIYILQEPKDNEEKPKQLEMMGEIYEKANNVLGWLGDPPLHIHNAKAYVE